MKKLILILGLILFAIHAESQAIEVYTNLMYATVDQNKIINNNFENTGFLTYSLGGNYCLKKSDRFQYILGLSYDKKGIDTDFSIIDKYVVTRYDFVTLRGLGSIILPKNEFQFGGYVGFLADVRILPDDNVAKEKIAEMRRYAFGITGIVNQQIFSTNSLSCYFKIEANYDLTSLWYYYNALSFTSFERNITLGAGFALRWNYKEK